MWFSSQISGVWPVPHSWNSWTSDIGTFARISLNINIHISRTAFLTSWCAYLRFDILQVTFWMLGSQCFLASLSLWREWSRQCFQDTHLRPISCPQKSYIITRSLCFLCREQNLTFPHHLWCAGYFMALYHLISEQSLHGWLVVGDIMASLWMGKQAQNFSN